MEVKKEKKSLKLGFLIQISVSTTKKVKIIGLGWGPGVGMSDGASGHSNVGGPWTML